MGLSNLVVATSSYEGFQLSWFCFCLLFVVTSSLLGQVWMRNAESAQKFVFIWVICIDFGFYPFELVSDLFSVSYVLCDEWSVCGSLESYNNASAAISHA